MIPNNNNYDEELDEEQETDFDIEKEPSLTYAMRITDRVDKDNFFLGRVDEEEALRQAILKIIHTERYEHEIYSWDYGIELQDLIGEQIPYVMSEIKRRIEDALTADERIDSVEDFTVEQIEKRALYITFTVITAEGEKIEGLETEVKV